jgi:hypothetical protein
MFLLSTTRLAKSSTNFVPILSPFGNELIKHKLIEEQFISSQTFHGTPDERVQETTAGEQFEL